MIIYVLIACVVLMVVYIKRNDIRRYFDKEMSEISDLNDIDDEVQYLIEYYSVFKTEDLVEMMNKGNLNEKDLKAVRKIITDR